MANFIERLLNGEKKTLHNLEKTAEQVMALANDMEALSDDALREKTQEYKHRYEEGETLDSLLVPLRHLVKQHAVRLVSTRTRFRSWVRLLCTRAILQR